MSGRDWFDDFMDYKLSGWEETNPSAHNGSCLPGILGVLLILVVLSLL